MFDVRQAENTPGLAFQHRRGKLAELTSATFIGMTHMKRHYSAAIAAAFLLTASSLAARAEDAAPAATAPAAAPGDSAPANVARPSIVPKSNDTAARPDAS